MGQVSTVKIPQTETPGNSAAITTDRQAGIEAGNNPLNTSFAPSTAEFRLNKFVGSPVFGLRCEEEGSVTGRELQGKLTRCDSKTLALATAFAIFDVDETIIANTGRYIHDGVGGRFESALRLTLRRALESVVLDRDRITDMRIKSELICEIRGRWKEDFASAFAGYQELRVCQEMCRIAEGKLRARGVNVTLDAKFMKKKSHSLVKRLFDMHKEDLLPVPGVRDLAQALKESGAKMALCTSSPEKIIRYLMNRQFPGWNRLFGKGHYDAVKKNGNSDFSASAIDETCSLKRLNCHPSETVMFGDSSADLGTAIMAGVPLVIIRPAQYDEKSLAKLEKSYADLQRKYPEKTARCAVIIVKDFSQVAVEPWHKLHGEFTSGQVELSTEDVQSALGSMKM